MIGMALDYLTALLAAISALFWVLSARVDFPYGFDNDRALSAAAKKAGRLNAIAASFAALASATPAVKTFCSFMHLI